MTELKRQLVKSPMNYTGGKFRLLPELLTLFPENISSFVDLFTGGANVAVNVNASKIYANDNDEKVISLLNYLKKNDTEEVIAKLEKIIRYYELSNTFENGYEYYNCNSSDGLGAYNRELYVQLRKDFNENRFISDKELIFFTLIVFGFNNQIRFNKKDEFNIPVGKRDFNIRVRVNLNDFITRLKEIEITFTNIDYRDYPFYSTLKENDFVYCDPPYLITTASYNEQGGWTREDEEDLLLKLDQIHLMGVKFALSNMLEKEGKVNDLLVEWSQKYVIHDMKVSNYSNANYQKKKTDVREREVLITNY